MSAWVVIPCLTSLQKEFDGLNPNRDKGAEGFVGDASHTSSSDHTPDEDSDKLRGKDSDHLNEVHAYDCDSTGPWPGTTFDKIVKKVIEGEKKKWNDPDDKCRLNYVIWDHYIYDKDNNFEPKWYTATPDPHTNHAHFSARYETSCEEDTRPWGILATFGDEMDQATFTAMLSQALTDIKIEDYADPNPTNRKLPWRTWIGYSDSRADVSALRKQVEEFQAKVDEQMAEIQHSLEEINLKLTEGGPSAS